jgi:hypothetical protein
MRHLVIAAIGLFFSVAALGQAPATQPTTRPFDPKAAMAAIDAAGGIYSGIHDAMEKKDYATALQLTDDLLKQSDDLKGIAAGSPIAIPVNMGLGQLQRFRDALAANNVDKATTLMGAMDTIGSKLADTIRALQSPATQPAK